MSSIKDFTYIFVLRVLRKIYRRIFPAVEHIHQDLSAQEASDCIKNLLTDGNPVMICRFGNVELNAIINYLAIEDKNKSLFRSIIEYIKGQRGAFWWEDSVKFSMQNNAGFFPSDDKSLAQFSKQVLKEMQYIDVLGSWLPFEKNVQKYFMQAKIVGLKDLEPYYHENPWSSALKGKKVLVIHPFAVSIEDQYKKRERLFRNENVLPPFELLTYKPVQSIAFEKTNFSSWFDALDMMCKEIDLLDYDVAIIGAGAYGFSLAAHVKKRGKKAIHLGGAVQILFGIKGKRWENMYFFKELFNDAWSRALEEEKPKNADNVEAGCYW